jgi:predicted AAA+ superfamily ATPase
MDLEQISRDPDMFLRMYPNHVAIDEAQQLPSLFPALRVAIDSDRSLKGRFLLTGSSSPELLHGISESLAGRVGIIEVSPFTFREVAAVPGSFFGSWIMDSLDPQELMRANSIGTIQDVHRHWLLGGYPEPWIESFHNPDFHSLWMEQYLRTYLDRDISRLFPKLDRIRFQRYIRYLAACSGQIINLSEIGRTVEVPLSMVKDYQEIAVGTFLWRSIPGYFAQTTKRLSKHPKGHLRDSGLLHHYLGIRTLEQLMSHPQMGHSWEAYVIENVLRGLDLTGRSYQTSYYRSSGGAEVDLVLECNGKTIPIEIKFTQTVQAKHIQNIRAFMTEFSCPVGVVLCNCEQPTWLEPGIVAFPVNAL